jgi:DNA-binding MarR family transcriptional regulator
MSELAERVMLSPSGCTRVVDQLVKQGLIERRRDSCDARSQLATLTGKGLDELRAAAPVHVRGIREHFTGRLDAAQLEAVASALEVVGADQTRGEALSRG